jgi:hypothetical protein
VPAFLYSLLPGEIVSSETLLSKWIKKRQSGATARGYIPGRAALIGVKIRPVLEEPPNGLPKLSRHDREVQKGCQDHQMHGALEHRGTASAQRHHGYQQCEGEQHLLL